MRPYEQQLLYFVPNPQTNKNQATCHLKPGTRKANDEIKSNFVSSNSWVKRTKKKLVLKLVEILDHRQNWRLGIAKFITGILRCYQTSRSGFFALLV